MSIALFDFSEALVGAVASAAVSIVRVKKRERLLAPGIIVTSHHGLERDENINVMSCCRRFTQARTLRSRWPLLRLAWPAWPGQCLGP